jgi:pimeloyl-ACP methyl ester carboxylesterase
MAFLGVLCALVNPVAASPIASYQAEVPGLSARLWVPEGKLDGVVVFTGGQGPGGSFDTRDIGPFWRQWVATNHQGIVGTRFVGSYRDAAKGSGDRLIQVLGQLATASNHPEVSTVPLTLAGFSNGGYFSYTFTALHPSRVRAFVVNKSGYATARLTSELAAVPGLFIKGELEARLGIPSVIDHLVQEGTSHGAEWRGVIDPGVAHEPGHVDRLMAQFFRR